MGEEKKTAKKETFKNKPSQPASQPALDPRAANAELKENSITL